MYEVWADGPQQHDRDGHPVGAVERLVLATDSYREAYEVAGMWGVVVWLVDRARSICQPLPHHG